MNIFHRWYCRSDGWARSMQQAMPLTLRGVELGDDVLEIGPGPGVTTDWLRSRVARLTSIEIDGKLSDALKARMAGTNVTVVKGDASAMPFPDGSYSCAVSFTMLHHVPAQLQDRLFAETYRVLRAGGGFAGMDSVPSLRWNIYHLFDDRNPVDPGTLSARLEAAGFRDASVHTFPGGFSFRATKP